MYELEQYTRKGASNGGNLKNLPHDWPSDSAPGGPGKQCPVTELTKGASATSLECPIQADHLAKAREQGLYWVERLVSLRSLGPRLASAYA
jgi:hypothetical protein